MKNKQKPSKAEPKNPKQQIKPAGQNLSEADLEKVAGGATYSTSRSNIRSPKGTT